MTQSYTTIARIPIHYYLLPRYYIPHVMHIIDEILRIQKHYG